MYATGALRLLEPSTHSRELAAESAHQHVLKTPVG